MEKDTSKSFSIEDVNNNVNNHLNDSVVLSLKNDASDPLDQDIILEEKKKTPKGEMVSQNHRRKTSYNST